MYLLAGKIPGVLLGASKMLNPPGICWWVLLNRQDSSSQLGTGILVSFENLLYLVLAQLFTTPKLLDPLLGRGPAGKAHPARGFANSAGPALSSWAVTQKWH